MPQMSELRPAVMALFVNGRGEILIGSSPRDGGWKIPQGGMDKGETPLEALFREVKEELGVILDNRDVHPWSGEKVTYMYPPSEPLRSRYRGQELNAFRIDFREEMSPCPQDDEFGRLEWIQPEDLEKYDTRHRARAYREALILYGLLEKKDE